MQKDDLVMYSNHGLRNDFAVGGRQGPITKYISIRNIDYICGIWGRAPADKWFGAF